MEGDKWVHTFLKGINPRVNVIEQLEFELVYNDFAVHHFNHYATETPSPVLGICGVWSTYLLPLLPCQL